MFFQGEGTFCQRFKILPNYSVAYSQNITPTHSRCTRPRVNKSEGKLSVKAGKRLRMAIRWMLLFSKEKKVYSREKKSTFSFRMNFVTLTLSAAQRHPDTYILHRMLFPFLKYLERSQKVTAYVWRAEIQPKRFAERGERCIHFHITLDKFVHWRTIRNKWNALQLAHGYTEPAADPNSTDVHSIRNVGKVIKYFAKYMAKDVDKDSLKVTCKIYGMSRNLSLMNCTLKEEEDCEFGISVDYFIEKFTYGELQTEHAKIYFNDLTMSDKYPEHITRKLRALHDMYHKGIEAPSKYYVD